MYYTMKWPMILRWAWILNGVALGFLRGWPITDLLLYFILGELIFQNGMWTWKRANHPNGSFSRIDLVEPLQKEPALERAKDSATKTSPTFSPGSPEGQC